MTPEALKLLAIVLARDGGFFDMKANVAARTELGASGYLRMEPHGKQCRLTITPMCRTALALGGKDKPVESNRTCVRSSRLTAFLRPRTHEHGAADLHAGRNGRRRQACVLVRDPNGAREPSSTLLVSVTRACRAV